MFKKTIVARALTIAFGATALGFAIQAPTMAQSNATGTINGKVESAAGSSLSIRNLDTGAQRKVTPGADGRYSITALPTGRYKVELSRNGTVVESQEVEVLLGQGVDASFAATAVQKVEVTTRRKKIDVSNTNNGATFTAKELAKLPIVPNVDAIIQLAPNTTRADSRYAGGASFGGGGASENAYYINGYPVTNPLTQLGATELPFGGIGQIQVTTGGFGAEFGRSVGGVVNLTTKHGTNNWEVGATYAISPNSLRARSRDLYYGTTGAAVNSATDGTLFRRRETLSLTSTTVGAYVGGPLIKDKLFMFLSAEQQNTRFSGANPNQSSASLRDEVQRFGWSNRKDKTTRYLGKFDWNLTDNHRLELTLLGDDSRRDEVLSGFTGAGDSVATPIAYSARTGSNGVDAFHAHYRNVPVQNPNGANSQIIKYTGNLTDNLTLTSLYGQSDIKHTNTFDEFSTNQTLYQVGAVASAQAPGLIYRNPNPISGNILPDNSGDKVKSFRLDLEYKLGKHTLRAGFDNNRLSSQNAGQFRAGGGVWTYRRTTTPNTGIRLTTQSGVIVASGGGLGTQGYYVREQKFNTATSVTSDQDAQYIEDKYQITKDFYITAGLRNEGFQNKNGDGQVFLNQKNQRSPRFATAWDVNGDASLKVYGSIGRYSIQVPTNIGVRGASRSTFTERYYTYTGVDANGAPTGLTPITGVLSSNNEFGQAKDPLTVTATNLKPSFQDELTVGIERSIASDYTLGARVTYRKLKSTIDDFCDARPLAKWLARHPEISTANYGGFGCASFNPGEDTSLLVDFNDANPALAGKVHTPVHLTRADMGFPSTKRSYFALDLSLEHSFRNSWYGKATYTWSRNRGNTEGQTLSDVAQTDVAHTRTWDYPELSIGADGLLPNDRTHQIKAFGYYELTPQFIIGGNFLAATGRPQNCLGNDPYPGTPGYASATFYCAGAITHRGSQGRLPWDISLDLNFVYKPQQVKGLQLKMDIFNVFNKQTAQNIDETYNAGTAVSTTFNRVISYTNPRTVRLTAEFAHKF
ncbi:MAG: hypothetical protein RL748_1201 [Pseudomonadota bacterium]